MRALADLNVAGPAGSARWGDLGKRALSAIVLAPVALLCIWAGGWPWAVLMGVAAAGLGAEWAMLCGCRPGSAPGLLVAMGLLGADLAMTLGAPAAAAVLLMLAAVAVWLLSRRLTLPAGVVYAGIPLLALLWLRGSGVVGRYDVLFLILVVWACDIGAYVVGRVVGGPRLAPSISPGKTWSGAVGGLLIAMGVGEVVAQMTAPGVPGRAAALACVLGVASIGGDLLESWIKRRFGVKDSGRSIPGHGGLLDRLDGLMGAAPAAAVMAMAMGRGDVLWH